MQEREKIRAEIENEATLKIEDFENQNKSTFQLVLNELHMIKDENESQIAKFDLLIDK